MQIKNSLAETLNFDTRSIQNLSIEEGSHLHHIGATNHTPLPCRMNYQPGYHSDAMNMSGTKLAPLRSQPRQEQMTALRGKIEGLERGKQQLEGYIKNASKHTLDDLNEQMKTCNQQLKDAKKMLDELTQDIETEKQIKSTNK